MKQNILNNNVFDNKPKLFKVDRLLDKIIVIKFFSMRADKLRETIVIKFYSMRADKLKEILVIKFFSMRADKLREMASRCRA